jgi:Pyruvate/2-oxoacid:ferredoxin oxidoreductase delta subunit
MGLAIIDVASCYAAQGQPCDYCVVRCPLGKEAIRLDVQRIPVVDAAGCTGCGVCAYLCPGQAIHIKPAD